MIGVIDIDRLFFIIVSRGRANAILRKAKECGITGGTIFMSEGTIHNRLIDRLGLTDIHKETLMLSAAENLCEKLSKETYKLLNKDKGIAFSIPFMKWQLKSNELEQTDAQSSEEPSLFCIIAVVDRGQSKVCLKAAKDFDAMSATVIHGHGAGTPIDFYAPLVIEPQKDVVMIITDRDKAHAIRERIFNDLGLDKAGNGIIFTLPVNWSYGIFDNKNEGNRGRIT